MSIRISYKHRRVAAYSVFHVTFFEIEFPNKTVKHTFNIKECVKVNHLDRIICDYLEKLEKEQAFNSYSILKMKYMADYSYVRPGEYSYTYNQQQLLKKYIKKIQKEEGMII